MNNARLRDRATVASISVAVFLLAIKLAAWLVTGSVAVLASTLDSLADLGASLVTRLTVRQAQRPADHVHRFGHGKAEPLGALVQAAVIVGSALLLMAEAFDRLIDPVPLADPDIGIAIMAVSMVAAFSLVVYQRFVVRRTRSIGIDADSRNYAGDLLIYGAVIASLSLYSDGSPAWIDTVVGLAIAAFLLFNAVGIGRVALDMLMDRELPTGDRDRIEKIVRSDPRVRGLHDLRTRCAGPTRFIDLHLELDGALTLDESHDIADDVEARLTEAFPGAEVLLHQEPAGLDDERLDRRILGSAGPD